MAEETYRAVIVFPAPTVKAAKAIFTTLVKSSKGDLEESRLTVARKTWGPVQDDGETQESE